MEKKESGFDRFLRFIKNVWLEPRIPTRDRWIIAICLFLILSPFDILPDFIPVIGVIDDLIILSFVLDYFFNRLDDSVILDHFPYNFKRFYNFRYLVSKINKISPQSMLHWLWKYKPPRKMAVKNVNQSTN